MGIIIRKAIPEDAYEHTMCRISCWQSAYKGIVPDEYLNNMSVDKEQQIEKTRMFFTNPSDIITFCVIFENKMIGYLTIQSVQAEIWAIYLVEEFRGKGYGKEVLNFAINELKRLKHKKLFLWVVEENNRAIRFYENTV